MRSFGVVKEHRLARRPHARARLWPGGTALGVAFALLSATLATAAGASAAPAGTITEYSAGLNAGSQPEQIAPGPDGNLWFIDGSSTIPAIGRITPAGAVTEFSAGLSSSEDDPNDLAPGPDGNLWFTDEATTGAIGRVTPSGTFRVGGLIGS